MQVVGIGLAWSFCAVLTCAEEPSPRKTPQREMLTNSIGMKLVLLPAGEYLRGADSADRLAEKNERPRHRVKLTEPFFIGIHEVTVGQFREFVKATGYVTLAEKGKSSGYVAESHTFQYDHQGFHWKNVGWKQSKDHPVLNVSWRDAVAFCEWLSRKEKRKYRLPTEAEWEYACRAGTQSRFLSGESTDQLQHIVNLQDQSLFALRPVFSNSETSSFLRKPVAWNDGYPFSAPVGSFRPNRFGLYDVLGNAAEWCGDWYHQDTFQKSSLKNPVGPQEGSARVIRGGAFLHQPAQCRASWRIGGTPTYHNYIIGFRVVAEVPQ